MSDSTVGNGGMDDEESRRGDAAAGDSLIYHSAELFQGRMEIIIRHDNANYRLRITRQGKLILNK